MTPQPNEHTRLKVASDAVTLEQFVSRLTPERRAYIKSLPPEALEYVEDFLRSHGESYYLKHWGHLQNQMDYLLTLL